MTVVESLGRGKRPKGIVEKIRNFAKILSRFPSVSNAYRLRSGLSWSEIRTEGVGLVSKNDEKSDRVQSFGSKTVR